jgi:hypothetical protein
MEQEAAAVLSDDSRKAAERILSRRFNGSVRVQDSDILRGPDARTLVFRLRLAGGGAAPETAILRQSQGADSGRFNPYETGAGTPAWRFHNDWSGILLLNDVQGTVPLVPRVIGADRKLGLLLLEDLGDSPSLADALLGDDPDRATQALAAYARMLGRVGSRTRDRFDDYQRLRRAAAAPKHGLEELRESVIAEVSRVYETFEEVGFEWTPALVDDIEQVSASMMHSGPFLTYTHGEPCPGNDVMVKDGMRLQDLEFGGFRHALRDGVFMRLGFPTCELVNRIPAHLLERLEGEYRYELAKGLPEAEDDRRFYRGMTEACAYWFIWTANRHLREALRFDSAWGISTLRQRFIFWSAVLAETSRDMGSLPALGGFAARLHDLLQAEWPATRDMPLYPAFRRAG